MPTDARHKQVPPRGGLRDAEAASLNSGSLTKLDYERYRPTRLERWRAIPWPARFAVALGLIGLAVLVLLWKARILEIRADGIIIHN